MHVMILRCTEIRCEKCLDDGCTNVTKVWRSQNGNDNKVWSGNNTIPECTFSPPPETWYHVCKKNNSVFMLTNDLAPGITFRFEAPGKHFRRKSEEASPPTVHEEGQGGQSDLNATPLLPLPSTAAGPPPSNGYNRDCNGDSSALLLGSVEAGNSPHEIRCEKCLDGGCTNVTKVWRSQNGNDNKVWSGNNTIPECTFSPPPETWYRVCKKNNSVFMLTNDLAPGITFRFEAPGKDFRIKSEEARVGSGLACYLATLQLFLSDRRSQLVLRRRLLELWRPVSSIRTYRSYATLPSPSYPCFTNHLPIKPCTSGDAAAAAGFQGDAAAAAGFQGDAAAAAGFQGDAAAAAGFQGDAAAAAGFQGDAAAAAGFQGDAAAAAGFQGDAAAAAGFQGDAAAGFQGDAAVAASSRVGSGLACYLATLQLFLSDRRSQLVLRRRLLELWRPVSSIRTYRSYATLPSPSYPCFTNHLPIKPCTSVRTSRSFPCLPLH
ncbi:hypothetical protein SKAU_G00417540 [Synaphobranchus kaupii]|uniref:Uncharacterized protein n=1 Tax=Synaphobranchus kaupii TaxID=118154 RepID=A0A9Q1E604_SYNKA|nr:hypothetical protein SKAU_G00417540 [Synaphobranchus kaupii]